MYTVAVEPIGDGYRAAFNGQTYEVEASQHQEGQLSLTVDGEVFEVYWAADGPLLWIAIGGQTYVFDKRTGPAGRSRAGAGEENVLRAPMPGQVRALEVSVGDRVEQGQTLMLLEAMKMEIRIQAPGPAEVVAVLAQAGQQVEREQRLVELKF